MKLKLKRISLNITQKTVISVESLDTGQYAVLSKPVRSYLSISQKGGETVGSAGRQDRTPGPRLATETRWLSESL